MIDNELLSKRAIIKMWVKENFPHLFIREDNTYLVIGTISTVPTVGASSLSVEIDFDKSGDRDWFYALSGQMPIHKISIADPEYFNTLLETLKTAGTL